jgi:hypothetical protein
VPATQSFAIPHDCNAIAISQKRVNAKPSAGLPNKRTKTDGNDNVSYDGERRNGALAKEEKEEAENNNQNGGMAGENMDTDDHNNASGNSMTDGCSSVNKWKIKKA